jgi:hypothetical protein
MEKQFAVKGAVICFLFLPDSHYNPILLTHPAPLSRGTPYDILVHSTKNARLEASINQDGR